MFKITPPHEQNVVNDTSPIPPHTGRRVLGVLVALFFACLIVFMGYRRGLPPEPVVLDRSLFYNADSLSYYMERAYTSDDPKALFVTGMASHLYYADPDFPQDLPTVDPDTDGDYMLLLAAELALIVYPCYTLTIPLRLSAYVYYRTIISSALSFIVSDTIRNFLIPRGACLKSFAELGGGTAFGLPEETVEMAECVETA